VDGRSGLVADARRVSRTRAWRPSGVSGVPNSLNNGAFAYSFFHLTHPSPHNPIKRACNLPPDKCDACAKILPSPALVCSRCKAYAYCVSARLLSNLGRKMAPEAN
jgi:hypothetical protein